LLEALAHKYNVTDEWSALLERSEFRALFRRRLDEVNSTFAIVLRVRNFTLLADPFLKSRRLTPTLKIKTRVVVETRRRSN